MDSKKNISDITSESLDNSQDYLEFSWEYYKLKAFLHTAELTTSLVKYLIYGFFSLMGLSLLSISLALFLGNVLGNVVAGYALVGIFYLTLLMVAFFLRKYIEKSVVVKLSKSLLNHE